MSYNKDGNAAAAAAAGEKKFRRPTTQKQIVNPITTKSAFGFQRFSRVYGELLFFSLIPI